jgi:hypothetical protein
MHLTIPLNQANDFTISSFNQFRPGLAHVVHGSHISINTVYYYGPTKEESAFFRLQCKLAIDAALWGNIYYLRAGRYTVTSLNMKNHDPKDYLPHLSAITQKTTPEAGGYLLCQYNMDNHPQECAVIDTVLTSNIWTSGVRVLNQISLYGRLLLKRLAVHGLNLECTDEELSKTIKEVDDYIVNHLSDIKKLVEENDAATTEETHAHAQGSPTLRTMDFFPLLKKDQTASIGETHAHAQVSPTPRASAFFQQPEEDQTATTEAQNDLGNSSQP